MIILIYKCVALSQSTFYSCIKLEGETELTGNNTKLPFQKYLVVENINKTECDDLLCYSS